MTDTVSTNMKPAEIRSPNVFSPFNNWDFCDLPPFYIFWLKISFRYFARPAEYAYFFSVKIMILIIKKKFSIKDIFIIILH